MNEKDELKVYKRSSACVLTMAVIINIYEMINNSLDNSVVSLLTMWLAAEPLPTFKYNKKKKTLVLGIFWLIISLFCFVSIFIEGMSR